MKKAFVLSKESIPLSCAVGCETAFNEIKGIQRFAQGGSG